MGADDLHVGAVVGHRHADLLEAAHHEAGEAADERDLARQRHAGADAHHVALGDAHVEEPLGMLPGELIGHGGLPEVSVEDDDVRIGFGLSLSFVYPCNG